jgi:hypothetical protein
MYLDAKEVERAFGMVLAAVSNDTLRCLDDVLQGVLTRDNREPDLTSDLGCCSAMLVLAKAIEDCQDARNGGKEPGGS